MVITPDLITPVITRGPLAGLNDIHRLVARM